MALADRAEKAAFLTSSFEIVECGPPAPVGSRGAALQPVVGPDARLLAQYARRYPLNGFSFFAYWQGGVTTPAPTSWDGAWIATGIRRVCAVEPLPVVGRYRALSG